MKVANVVLKVVALALGIAAAVCLIIAFWDKIVENVGAVVNKIHARQQYAEGCYVVEPDDDYTDWDE